MPYPPNAVKAGRSKARSGIAGILLREELPKAVSTQSKFREPTFGRKRRACQGRASAEDCFTRPTNRAEKTEDSKTAGPTGYLGITPAKTPDDTNPAATHLNRSDRVFKSPARLGQTSEIATSQE
jgi:hypothetical protein